MASLRISGIDRTGSLIARTGGVGALSSRPRRTRSLVFFLCAGALVASSARAQQHPVVIEGGPDDSGHGYAWVVTNQHDSPIIEIEFPHFRADLFTVPDGWRQETTFLVNIGVPEKEGVCKAIAPNVAEGIAPGQSKAFEMRITAKGASRGFGTVTVGFADGTSVRVNNVALPRQEAALSRFIGLLGLGAVLGVWILVRSLRGRRSMNQSGSEEDSAGAS